MRHALAIALLVMATPARADRAAVERLAKDAEAEHDLAKFEACGRAYVDLYNQTPEADRAAELLYNAGACFESGKSIGAALQVFDRLRTELPHSLLAAKVLPREGRLYARFGQLDEAAKLFELFARQFAGEKEAINLLQDAIAMRAALGDDPRQSDDASLFVRNYGGRRPDEAASVMFSLIPAYEKRGRDAAIAFLEQLLRTQKRALGPDRTMTATTRLGELQWDKSCPAATLDGLCVKVVGGSRGDKTLRCRDQLRLEVVPRTSTKQAQERLRAAAAFEQGRSTDVAARSAYARARLREADLRLEAFLAVPFPTGLDFSPDHHAAKEKSVKRFNGWLTQRTTLGAEATRSYEDILALEDPESSLAAAARIGQLTEAFAAEIATAEIPKDVRSGKLAKDKTAAFCEQMTVVAEPLASRAIEAFRVCIAKSSELGLDDTWTALCERELGKLDPKSWPPRELLAPLVPVLPELATAPLPMAAKGDPAEYGDALAKLAATDPAKWTPAACRDLTTRLTRVAVKHAPAQHALGVLHERCGKLPDARAAYEAATRASAVPGSSLVNLGVLHWRAGARDQALAAWEAALKVNPKLSAAHLDLAVALFGDGAREQEVESHVASVLAIDDDEAVGSVAYALVALGHHRDEVARYYLDRATRPGDPDAPLLVARAIHAAHRGAWPVALASLEAAAKRSPAAGYDLAIVDLQLRRYQDAMDLLARQSGATYDLELLRGVAARGLDRLPEAKTAYERAIALDPARPEAHFDLGVLDARLAVREADPAAAKALYAKAAAEVRIAKAKDLADDLDRRSR